MRWTSIRIDLPTHRRLEQFRANLERSHGYKPASDGKTPRVSMGQAIDALLTGIEGRRERCKRVRRKRADDA